jgi:hypothetical protein
MTLIDKFPKHQATQDFEQLANRLVASYAGAPAPDRKATNSLLKSLFGRKAIAGA